MAKLQSNSRHWRYTLKLPEAVQKEAERRARLASAVADRKAKRQRRDAIPVERLESTEQTLLVMECLRRGWRIWKLTAPGRRGWPDTFVLDHESKKCAFVELKSKDRRSRAFPAQKRTVEILQASGQNAYIATGYKDAIAYLEGVLK